MKFRNLRADEIECRVGMIREKGFTLLLYKDARCDMNILDESVGAENWQRDHYECKGNLFARVGIKCGNEWVWKADCGTESNTEKEKGEASDSFKRACVNWGIGRELYSSPFIWIGGHVKKEQNGKLVPDFKSIKVVDIGYSADGNKITHLSISGDGETIYEFGRKAAQNGAQGIQPKNEQSENAKAQEKPHNASQPLTLAEAVDFTTTGGKPYAVLTEDQLRFIIENSRIERCREAARLVLKDREEAFEDLPPLDEENLPF